MLTSPPAVFSQQILPVVTTLPPKINVKDKSLHAFGIHIATISEVTTITSGSDFYSMPIATFTDMCWSIIRNALSVSLNIPEDEVADNDLPKKWHALVAALAQIDHYKLDDENAYQFLRDKVVFDSADKLKDLSLNPGDRQVLESVKMAVTLQAKLDFQQDCGQKFVRLIYSTIVQHAPFVGTKGDIGMAPTTA
jgi:hypothetical protein